MWTQRDQVQAYGFLRRRLVSALVSHDANHPVSPSRRLVLGTVFGVVAAVLVAGVFGVLGFLHPATSDDWKQGGHVIVEKETGTRYVLTSDGRLHPVVNYASARLLAGGDGTAVSTVAAKTLDDVPRGALLGIPGAPDSVPTGSHLISGTWTVCTQTPADQPIGRAPTTTVLLSATSTGTALSGPAAVVVRPGSASPTYVVTSGHRYLASRDALTALGLDSVDPVPASAAWLTAVPAGRDLGVLSVDHAGTTGPRVGDTRTRVGQVLTVTTVGASARFYVVTADGLATASPVEAALVLAGPDADRAYGSATPRAVVVSGADVARAPRAAVAGATPAEGGYPAALPRAAQVADGAAICATTSGADSATVRVSSSLPLPSGAKPVAAPGSTDLRVADQVYVPPGRGALVAEQGAGGADTGTVYLVTDTGEKYALPSSAAIASLGLASTARTSVPAGLLDLLPAGPSLNPADAAHTVDVSTGSSR